MIIMKTFSILVSLIIVLFLAAPNKVTAQRAKAVRTVTGTMSKVEWGDNFYLTIIDGNGRKHTALCSAPICSKFSDDSRIPKRYKGKKVKATLGKRTRYDGGGNAMDKYDAFIKIQFLR
jgi:hypothetical protein